MIVAVVCFVCSMYVLQRTRPFNGLLSGITRVSQYQKGKTKRQ